MCSGFTERKGGKAEAGDQDRVDDQAKRLTVYHFRIGHVLLGDALVAAEKVLCRHEQGIVVRGYTTQTRPLKVDSGSVKTVLGPFKDVSIGREQVHGSIILGRVPFPAEAHDRFHVVHAARMIFVLPQGAGETAHQETQAIGKQRLVSKETLI